MSDESSGGVPVYYHPLYESHVQPPGHPECPERVQEIIRAIRELGVPVDFRTPTDADIGDVTAIHTMGHYERVRDFGVGHMDPDTYHDDHTYGYAMKAAGGTIMAAEAAVEESRPTFSLPRPPGHHAGRDYNMGFCYYNNVAIAARRLQKDHEDINRIAIIDVDAHHGNGTNDIFITDPSVLYISTHQWAIFPGTGHEKEIGFGDGEGKTVNLPMMGGSGDPTYREVWESMIRPIISQFRPDMMIVSLGGDAHLMDPLTGLTLSTPGYHDILKGLLDLSSEETSGRITFTLEGGYHVKALAEIFAGAVNMASDDPVDMKTRYNETREVGPDKLKIKDFREIQSGFWKV